MKSYNRDFLDRLSFYKNDIYIVGAGRYGEIIGNYLDKVVIKWKSFVDCNKRGSKLGKDIMSYDQLHDKNAIYLISSTGATTRSMCTMLLEHGIPSDLIYYPENKEMIAELYEDQTHYQSMLHELSNLEGIYQGKRCFVIGNGPSLSVSDLEKITSEYAFACNSIYALFEKTKWRPTFYCAYDPIFCEEWLAKKENINFISDNCDIVFAGVFSSLINYRTLFKSGKLRLFQTLREFGNELPLFSEDCSKGIYTSGTVTYVMLQLAVYLGFKEIVLIGVDCSYSVEEKKDGTIIKKDVVNHQKDIEEIDKNYEEKALSRYGHLANIDFHVAGYKASKRYADIHEIRILNATRGGELEVFERVDLDKLLEDL